MTYSGVGEGNGMMMLTSSVKQEVTSLSSNPISMSLNDGIFFRLPIAATAALLSSIWRPIRFRSSLVTWQGEIKVESTRLVRSLRMLWMIFSM